MPPTHSLDALHALRSATFHWNERARLKDAAAIRKFVDARGVCMLFPVQTMDMPNVYQAVAGFQKDMTAKHGDPAISLTWNTKDNALDKRWWYYGKLLRAKATLVALDLLPSFYALSENFGNDEEDYLTEYQAGTLSAEAKNIYEALLKHGALHAIELKRKANLYGDESKSRFDKALNDLQTGLKVMPVGVAEAGAWRYAFIYQIVSRWLPDLPAQAEKITRQQARVSILRRHLANVVYCTPRNAGRIFGWPVKETAAAIATLVDAREAESGATIEGVRGECVVAVHTRTPRAKRR